MTDGIQATFTGTVSRRLAARSYQLGDCVVSTFATRGGYPQIAIWQGGIGRTVGVHIAAWELVNGPVPAGYILDHVCHDPETCLGGRNCPHRRCFNVDHLRLSTNKENSQPSRSRMHPRSRVTECPQGHPYDEANTYYRPTGGRSCRACSAASYRKHMDKKRQGK